jgi:CDP-paratose 2-epimerase
MTPGSEAPIVVVGGCGFIGCNLADSLLASGCPVTVIDNLSRAGVEENLRWLTERHGKKVTVKVADIRDAAVISSALSGARAIYHLAAQTAVTTSLADPIDDFETNARGTLNVLEAVRRSGERIPVIFASTNKVYGSLEHVDTVERDGRYAPADAELAAHGVGEDSPLDFCTPYGCSKGVADQYVLDYAASYGIPTAVLRMSCIYGPHQFGTEDQGWVAHFLIRALSGEPLTIFGDGKQVRDVLHVSDAVAAYRLLLERIERLRGQAFNLGGGPDNAISLNDLIAEIRALTGRNVTVRYEAPRTGDQPYFVADTRRLRSATGWTAKCGWREGVGDLAAWLARNRVTGADARKVRAVA